MILSMAWNLNSKFRFLLHFQFFLINAMAYFDAATAAVKTKQTTLIKYGHCT